MRAQDKIYDIFSQSLVFPGAGDGILTMAWLLMLMALRAGTSLVSVAGTAITGTLSGANKIMTRDDGGFYVQTQTLTVSSVVGTDDDERFRLGEGITQASTGAKGVVVSVTRGADILIVIVDTITVALFTASNDIAGDDSSVAASVDSVTTQLQDLANKVVFAHISGTTSAGVFTQVVSNTATALTTSVAMLTGATAVILFDGQEVATMAVDLALKDEQSTPSVLMAALDAATEAIAAPTIKSVTVFPIDASSNVVAATLPDVRTVAKDQEFVFVGIDAETNAFTLLAQNAAQTLDGDDISSGGTPYAALDANGDSIVVKRSGDVWIIAQSQLA